MNFWQKLKKPFFILAPMDGVTDTVFRQIVASVGKPDVFLTEFVPVDALMSKHSERALETLKFTESERPMVAQIWGSEPEKFYKVAQMLAQMKFDGIDINMGCPDKAAVRKGGCSALIKNPQLAVEIIEATIKGAGGLPVSVKTRIGFSSIDTENWVTSLLQTPISALILHLRTVREMSKPPAHWDEISKAVLVRNKIKSKALIIGNGDIKSLKEARDKCLEYGIDGVMIGRGIFENPWVFNEKIDIEKVSREDKIALFVRHLELYKTVWGQKKNFANMKKFVKTYVKGFREATEVREDLMRTKSIDELIQKSQLTHPRGGLG